MQAGINSATAVFAFMQVRTCPFSRNLEQGNAMNTFFTASLAALSMLVACATPNAASPTETEMGVLTNPAGMTL